jgi:hypothetical protein
MVNIHIHETTPGYKETTLYSLDASGTPWRDAKGNSCKLGMISLGHVGELYFVSCLQTPKGFMAIAGEGTLGPNLTSSEREGGVPTAGRG